MKLLNNAQKRGSGESWPAYLDSEMLVCYLWCDLGAAIGCSRKEGGEEKKRPAHFQDSLPPTRDLPTGLGLRDMHLCCKLHQ